ncbi:unnamed protein product, partial [Mesorhabditis belari]|uniref:UDP-N-acetylmuramate:L-alanyl-gamma-D-glutamyl-meso-diaminopimelate ligase n=1 Tax=Mesorhabditis belari TaxID=2138241 RepID=A0AAF3EM78_9BILA
MGSIALLARELGHKVTGADENSHPPMSTMLEAHGIEIISNYSVSQLTPRPDLVIVGKTRALARGNPIIEYIMNEKISFVSGPQWIYESILKDRWVIAVSGTHGKTSTTSMIVWIMEKAGLNPGYLIGGVPVGLPGSSRLSQESPYFVIEADEYGTAFFDERPKMLLYYPKTLIINNLEMDHGDFYETLKEIEIQFDNLVKMIPSNGLIVHPTGSAAIDRVISDGCWTRRETTGGNGNWTTKLLLSDGSSFEVFQNGKLQGKIEWDLIGDHFVSNSLSAIAAVNHIGVSSAISINALHSFKLPKRRLEKFGQIGNIEIIIDYGHHPTAFQANLKALRNKYGKDTKIFTAIDPSTGSLKLGIHQDTMLESTKEADFAYFWKTEKLHWDIERIRRQCEEDCRFEIYSSVEEIIDHFLKSINNNVTERVIFIAFTSFAFDNLPQKLFKNLQDGVTGNEKKEL